MLVDDVHLFKPHTPINGDYGINEDKVLFKYYNRWICLMSFMYILSFLLSIRSVYCVLFHIHDNWCKDAMNASVVSIG